MTVAVLDGGASYHHEAICGPRFRDHFDRVVYSPDLGPHDLQDIEALIVADRIIPTILRRKRRILLDHLNRGGTLVVLGENRAYEWLPGVSWRFRPTNFWWWLEKDADPGHRIVAPDHEMFRYVRPADVVWHYHGLLALPADAIPLVTIAPEADPAGEGGCILYDHPGVANGRGRLVVTTLDPFYHHGSHFMPAATRFLDGLLRWTDAAFRG
jgi:hypothetical protein